MCPPRWAISSEDPRSLVSDSLAFALSRHSSNFRERQCYNSPGSMDNGVVSPQPIPALADIANAIRDPGCVLFLGAAIHSGPPEGSRFVYPVEERPASAPQLSRL